MPFIINLILYIFNLIVNDKIQKISELAESLCTILLPSLLKYIMLRVHKY